VWVGTLYHGEPKQLGSVVSRKGREVGWPPETDGGEYSTEKSAVPTSVPSVKVGGHSASRGGQKCRNFLGTSRNVERWRESEITPGFGKGRRKDDATTAQEKHRTERLGAVKAESATRDSSQLVVDAFCAPVREPSSE
jgi:hypothetical protein